MKNFSLFAIAALLLHAQHSFCADQKQLRNSFVLNEGVPCHEDYFYYEKWNPDHTRGYRESIGSQTKQVRQTILENVGHLLTRQGIKVVFNSFLIRPWQNILVPSHIYIPELGKYFYLTPSFPISTHCYSNDSASITHDIVDIVLMQISEHRSAIAAIGALDQE